MLHVFACSIVLRVTEEILDREVTSPASTTVESIWAQVFSTLSSPKLLQKMAGRRLCSTELRFVLLCALLSTSVHPTCDDRITYINRIMTLSKPVQHSLMTLIESFPKTPNKAKSPGRFRSPARPTATASALRANANVGRSPGRRTPGRLIRTPMSSRRSSNDEDSNSVAETPRSSNARRRFPADTNNCFLKNNKNNISATKLKMFPEEPDLLALMGWIRSFPQLHGLGSLSQLEVLNDVKVSLYVTLSRGSIYIMYAMLGTNACSFAQSNSSRGRACLRSTTQSSSLLISRRYLGSHGKCVQQGGT